MASASGTLTSASPLDLPVPAFYPSPSTTLPLPNKRFNPAPPSHTKITATTCAPDGLPDLDRCVSVTAVNGSIILRPPPLAAVTTLSAIPGPEEHGVETVLSSTSVGPAAPRMGNSIQGVGKVVKGMLRRDVRSNMGGNALVWAPSGSEGAAAIARQVLKSSATTLTVFETETAATVMYYPPASPSSKDGLPDISTVVQLTTKTVEPSQATSSCFYTFDSIVSCGRDPSLAALATSSLAVKHNGVQSAQACTTVYTTVIANNSSSSGSSQGGFSIGNPLRPGWSATIANMSVLLHPWTATGTGPATEVSVNISTFSADLAPWTKSYLSAAATSAATVSSEMMASSATVADTTPHRRLTSVPAKSGDPGFAGFTPATTVNIGSSAAAGGKVAGMWQMENAGMTLAILTLAVGIVL